MATKSLSSYNQVKHDVFQGETINSHSMSNCYSSALTASGRLFVWGKNAFSQLGDISYENYRLNPEEINTLFNLNQGESISYVSLGSGHSSVITSLGRLFMWGDNFYGEIGDGTTKVRNAPIDITPQFKLYDGETIIQTSLGLDHSSAITSLGRLFMWGYNRDGELGDGTTNHSSIPLDITENFKLGKNEIIKLIKVAQARSTALTSFNRLFIWGDNSDGSIPVDITSSLNLNEGEIITDINVQLWELYVLTSLGRLLDVNYKYQRSREIKSIEDLSQKFTLQDSDRISQISLERFQCAVLTSQGRLFMWGSNNKGQLGDGTLESRKNPVDITERFKLFEGETITAVSLGWEHSSALTSKGRLFMWGENWNGELGDGAKKNRLTPVDITGGGVTTSR